MTLKNTVTGLHHITAISSDAQKTNAFYTQVLGLRLVKKSVNQDDVATYHLFFGNQVGSPGMDLTFFPFQPVREGRQGIGSVTCIQLAVPQGSFDFWQQRFAEHDVEYQDVHSRFGTQRLPFRDFDGQSFELVAVDSFDPQMKELVWESNGITKAVAIHNFYSVRMQVPHMLSVEPVLALLGYEQGEGADEAKDTLFQFECAGAQVAKYLEVEVTDPRTQPEEIAISGAGTVHHIAFGVPGEAELVQYQTLLAKSGIQPTQVIDRYYFKSVYFRIPAGILFELATHEPGFLVDESIDELGEKLVLPPFLEDQRDAIERQLPELSV